MSLHFLFYASMSLLCLTLCCCLQVSERKGLHLHVNFGILCVQAIENKKAAGDTETVQQEVDGIVQQLRLHVSLTWRWQS